MANTCEPAIKIVMGKRAKVVVSPASRREMRLKPKGNVGQSAALTLPPRGWYPHRSTAGAYPHILHGRNVETPYASRPREDAGEWAGREARRPACGLGMSEEANAAL